MATTEVTYYLDEVKGGAGPGNRGDNFAIFRTQPLVPMQPHAAGQGEFKLYTSDWIKRGRPTEITINIPDERRPLDA